jgi:hypothetical protein
MALVVKTILLPVLRYQNEVQLYYEELKRLGEPDGIFWDEALNGWIVTRFSACATSLGSRDFAKAPISLGLSMEELSFDNPSRRAQSILNAQMISCDSAQAAAQRQHWRRIPNPSRPNRVRHPEEL